MMPENEINIRQKVQTGLVLAALLLACGYLISIFIFERDVESKRTAPDYIMSFTGIADGTDLKASIEMNGKTENIPFDHGKLVLTEQQKTDFTLPYRIKVTLKTGDERYHDLMWEIDSRGVEYNITADGFLPEDTILLALDGQTALDIPFDWSGRIVLPVMLIIAKDTKACIEIWDKKNLIGACHVITGKLPV